MSLARALPLSLLLLATCAHAPQTPTRVLDDAATAARSPDASARVRALAGFRALLVDGKPDQAGSHFADALKQDPGEPYALFGEIVLADRVAHPEVALAAALELCVRSPGHPLAPLAAHAVATLAGRALGMDALILTRAPEALARGAAGDTALFLRPALGSIQARRDAAAAAAVRADAGVVTTLSLVGPLAVLRALDFDAPPLPERDGAMPATLPGPFGAMPVRTLPIPDGDLSLAFEAPPGDVYVAGVDLEVATPGTYVVRTAGNGAFRTVLDGTVLSVRRPFAAPASLITAPAVVLSAGRHRLLVVMLRGERAAGVALAVFRADGQPAGVRFSPATGPAPTWGGSVSTAKVAQVFPTAASIRDTLLPEAGDALATYLAVRDAEGRDRDGAKRLLSAPTLPTGAAWSSLRAQVEVGDTTVPSKIAHGRAAQFLEAALEKDPGDVGSQLDRAALALDEQRTAQASEAARAARAAHTPVGYPVDLLQARLSLALGLDAQGDVFALEALQAVDGVCAALALRYDLAMRRDAVSDADRLLTSLRACPGEEGRAVEHAKSRGRLEEAAALATQRLQSDPASPGLAQSLASILLAQKRATDAVAVLSRMHGFWPRDAGLLKRMAELQSLAGDAKAALASREEALRIDGGDLSLRRSVERARTGKELLADQAVDGRAAGLVAEPTLPQGKSLEGMAHTRREDLGVDAIGDGDDA